MKTLPLFCCLLFTLSIVAQPVKLELGMRRNTSQTFMGKTKIDSYVQEKTTYIFPDNVFLTIEFNEEDYCKGFYFFGKNESEIEKTLTGNGFTKKDSLCFGATGFKGILKKEESDSQITYRFVADTVQLAVQQKKPVQVKEETPKEKPFYGFTILGTKVWEKKEK